MKKNRLSKKPYSSDKFGQSEPLFRNDILLLLLQDDVESLGEEFRFLCRRSTFDNIGCFRKTDVLAFFVKFVHSFRLLSHIINIQTFLKKTL